MEIKKNVQEIMDNMMEILFSSMCPSKNLK